MQAPNDVLGAAWQDHAELAQQSPRFIDACDASLLPLDPYSMQALQGLLRSGFDWNGLCGGRACFLGSGR